MKNLRITLLYKTIIIILLLTIGITFYRIISYKSKEVYQNEIIGIVKYIKYDNSKIEIELENKNILVTKYVNTLPNIKLGDKIKVIGKISIPQKNTIPNLFNYQKFLLSKKINYIMNADEIKKISDNTNIKYKIKNIIIEHINNYKTKDYLNTFILGNNTVQDNIKTSIRNNGISHLFAVSGMHLSMFSSILFFVLRKLKIHDNINYFIIILFFVFFAFLTNYSPSILRSLFMFIGLSINKIFDLKIKSIYICLITLIILLLLNPFYIYNIGFIFSYTVSITLIICNKKIESKSYFKSLLLISLISFIVSIPILFQNYYQINILTPLVNIIFVPFVSFIIFPLSLITFIIKPLDHVLFLLIQILEQLSLFLEHFSINIILAKTPWYIIIIYYVIIIISIDGILYKNYKKIISLVILIIIHTNIKYFDINSNITMLDVGQGDSLLIELKHNKGNILIDTGGKYNSNIINTKTIPYLKSHGITKINYLIITHGDYDHMGEAINLLENFKVDKVIFNCGEYNDLEKDLIKVLDKKNIKYYSCIKKLNVDKYKFNFLQTKIYDNENDNSNVIYTNIDGINLLFMGDASSITEKEIMSIYNLPNIDILKVGHHGSDTSSSKGFIDKINPNISIISVGKNNRYRHPKESVLDTLKESKIYRTDLDGSIEIKLNNGKYKIRTCSP
ncbi:MAG: DNA internalization-related competence protein ComEC/Rec2 [Bacilli bacterium]|nr:DNA internalization-related competence protein ComEC/Rec2 [Bacilli bacterium]